MYIHSIVGGFSGAMWLRLPRRFQDVSSSTRLLPCSISVGTQVGAPYRRITRQEHGRNNSMGHTSQEVMGSAVVKRSLNSRSLTTCRHTSRHSHNQLAASICHTWLLNPFTCSTARCLVSWHTFVSARSSLFFASPAAKKRLMPRPPVVFAIACSSLLPG